MAFYFSFHPNKNFAWYVSPKIIHQFEIGGGLGDYMYIGGNIGLQKRISSVFSIIGEVGGFYVFDDELIYQAGVGFVFDLE